MHVVCWPAIGPQGIIVPQCVCCGARHCIPACMASLLLSVCRRGGVVSVDVASSLEEGLQPARHSMCLLWCRDVAAPCTQAHTQMCLPWVGSVPGQWKDVNKAAINQSKQQHQCVPVVTALVCVCLLFVRRRGHGQAVDRQTGAGGAREEGRKEGRGAGGGCVVAMRRVIDDYILGSHVCQLHGSALTAGSTCTTNCKQQANCVQQQ